MSALVLSILASLGDALASKSVSKSWAGYDAPADARSDAPTSLTLRYRYRFANANATLSMSQFYCFIYCSDRLNKS
ncbi:hypothetical protein [Nostoc sp.]|uniref:hypothetical protein n=1 Tax=Nostoc sp. TaxID=1180 RepID=UPI002FF98A5C